MQQLVAGKAPVGDALCLPGHDDYGAMEADMKKLGFFQRVKGRDIAWHVVFIFIILCIRSSVFASYQVPTDSMSPTIIGGDFFFANKLAYRLKLPFSKATLAEWKTPERGDIIVFKYPPNEREDYTKRVIGVPGDVVEIVDKSVYVNGTAIEKRYIGRSAGALVYEENLFGTRHLVHKFPHRTAFDTMRRTAVPEGYLFVMGDNRDNSLDSRAWGFVPFENVEGKLVLRWLSIDPGTHLPRLDRIGLIK
jgi:signal peptidase I